MTQELCTHSLGAKMGIGKNKDCDCSKCEATKVANKAYKTLVETYMECGSDIWKERCYNWGIYKDINQIEVPGNQRVSSDQGCDECAEEVWNAHWIHDEEEVDRYGEEEDVSEGAGSWVSRPSPKYVEKTRSTGSI